MFPGIIFEIGEKILGGGTITFEEAQQLAGLEGGDIPFLLALANKVREKYAGPVDFCSILNARSGHCGEDCAFCAQSAFHCTQVEVYPLLGVDSMVRAAKEAEEKNVDRFSIVTSGRGAGEEEEFIKILEAIRRIDSETRLKVCGSLGIIGPMEAAALRDAGLKRYHHNLETSPSFFNEICTTHTFEERVKTVRVVQEAGLECCSGGIIGMGESIGQRIELAFVLKELNVDSIPINILNPIEGTKLAGQKPLLPMEILKTLAIFRLVLPDRGLRYAGGREVNLRDMQALGLLGGVNGLLTGGYLTTGGQGTDRDRQMVADLGL